MRVENPACVYTRGRSRKSVSFIAIFALAVLAATALVVGVQHPTVALAGGAGGGNGLTSLKTVAVPRPTNLARFIKDEQAAIALGKALFWDQQVGSDGQSCASCHFHAGADSRSKNQLDPGLRAVPPDPTFQLGGPNFQLKASDFPLHKLANPNDRNSAVLFDTNDIVSSQGVRNITFTNVIVGNTTDAGISIPDPIFSVNGVNVRRVEPRNTPTMINAVFNFRNFWDGRARNEFNGVDPIGNLDPGAKVLRVAAPGQAPQLVSLIDGSHPELALNNSSLASQAVGPPLSDFEMSFAGRTFVLLARKMVAARALGLQHVAPDDSALGSLSAAPGTGLKSKYDAMIRAAIQSEWWDSSSVIQINPDGSLTILPAGAAAAQNRFSMMEVNFSLIWGLSVQEYMATLEQVVDFYSRGGDFAKENAAVLSDRIKNLGLSAEDKAALVAFLKALTDERVRLDQAPFDHPELFVPNGSIGNANTVLADGTGNSVQDTLRIPAVGRNGVRVATPNFLE